MYPSHGNFNYIEYISGEFGTHAAVAVARVLKGSSPNKKELAAIGRMRFETHPPTGASVQAHSMLVWHLISCYGARRARTAWRALLETLCNSGELGISEGRMFDMIVRIVDGCTLTVDYVGESSGSVRRHTYTFASQADRDAMRSIVEAGSLVPYELVEMAVGDSMPLPYTLYHATITDERCSHHKNVHVTL